MDINRNKGAGRLFLPEESYDTAATASEEELVDIATTPGFRILISPLSARAQESLP